MTIPIRRRELMAALAGTAIWPLVVRAQQVPGGMRRVGWLDLFPPNDPNSQARVKGFQQAIESRGWSVGRNLAIDYHWGLFDLARARTAAAEALSRSPDVVLCAGTPSTLAMRDATRSVPIVFAIVSEPIDQGIVPSLAHPGGNITGFSYLESTIGAKWVELLKEIAAPLAQVALVFNPESSPYSRLFLQSIEAAAPRLAVRAIAAPVREPADIEQAIARLAGEPGSGAIFSADGFIYTNRKLIIELAARYRLPAIYGIPGTAAEGGLIYYCVDTVDSYRKAAVYVDRILRGEKPGDLPVQQPTQFQLSVNRKTAGALGLAVPSTLLVAADEIID